MLYSEALCRPWCLRPMPQTYHVDRLYHKRTYSLCDVTHWDGDESPHKQLQGTHQLHELSGQARNLNIFYTVELELPHNACC